MSMGQPWGPWGTSSLLEPSPAQSDSVVSPRSHPGARTGYTMCHSAGRGSRLARSGWGELQLHWLCLGQGTRGRASSRRRLRLKALGSLSS